MDFAKPGVAASAALQDALAAAVQGDHVLHFPPGEYHFYPEECPRKYCWSSNNDEGIKTIAMLLDSVDDFTISGQDALLIFHGRISPLVAFNCRNLKVEGLRVDFADSFVSDADLVRREKRYRFCVIKQKALHLSEIQSLANGLQPDQSRSQ